MRATSSKFLEGYKAEGVAINAVTVQNETDAEQEGHMPACLWAQEQEMEFVAKLSWAGDPQSRVGHKDLAARSQLQPLGPRDRRTQRSGGLRMPSMASPGTATWASLPR